MKRLIVMIQFTTRIPIPHRGHIDEKDLQEGMKYLPLVGLIIGAVMWLSYRLIFGFDPILAAVAAVLAEVYITGGLHMDGLADTFDGLYSNKNKEQILEVMKDSRLGTHGVLAVVGTLMLKAALVNALLWPPALIAMPVFSRLAMVYGAAFSSSARQSGLGYVFIKGVGRNHALLASLLTLLVTLYFLGIVGAVAAAVSMLVISLLFIRVCSTRIGGMTGDTLGALGEIASLGFLVVCSILTYL